MATLFKPNAPKFHALWEHREGRRVFVVPKAEWSSVLQLGYGAKVPLALDQIAFLPFARLALEPHFRGALAQRSTERIELSVWRYDAKDNPTPYNVDRYLVLPSLPNHLNIQEMVETGSTSLGVNFDCYRYGHFFLLPEKPSVDHWATDLPRELTISILKAG